MSGGVVVGYVQIEEGTPVAFSFQRSDATGCTEPLVLQSDLAAAIARADFHELDAGAMRVQMDVLRDGIEVQRRNALELHALWVGAEARAAAAERDAARWRFCVERDVMPVIANDGKTWCMFTPIRSNRRSLFMGKTPAEAVDAAIAAQQETRND